MLTILTQTLQINCKATAMKNRIKGRAWCSQEPQRALRWGLLEVISSAHCAAFPRPSDYTPCFCVSRPAGGESSVCSPFCSLHYHADNIRLFSRKAWDPCSFPRLSSGPWKEEKQRGACSAASGQAMGWRWCQQQRGPEWLQPDWSCSVQAWRGHRRAAASHLTKPPGAHSAANKVPAKHEGKEGRGSVPRHRAPGSSRTPHAARRCARGADGDRHRPAERDFAKGSRSTEGRKQNLFSFRWCKSA